MESSLTSMSKDLNNLYKNTEIIHDTRSIPEPENMKNNLFQAEVKKEQDDLQQTSLLQRGNINNPEWNGFKLELIPENSFMYEHDKPEFVQLEKKVFEQNEECILDFSGSILDGSDESSSKQIEVPVRTENYETIICEDENRAELLCDEWKTKFEAETQGENFIQNNINWSSVGMNQEKRDESKKHRCPVCNFQTKRKNDLNRHLLQHKDPDEVETFRCHKCDFKTIYKFNLKTHLVQHENREDINFFKCDQCDYQALQKGHLKVHLLMHKDPKEIDMFRCQKCDFQTIYKSSFKTHLRQHENRTEIELFKCDYCEYRALQKGHLMTHILRHKNEEEVYMYKCDQCDYKTIRNGTLRRHQLCHKDPKELEMFRCGKCDFKTIRKYNLRAHILRHGNRRETVLIKCDYCEFQTFQIKSFKKHFFRHESSEKVNTQQKMLNVT